MARARDQFLGDKLELAGGAGVTRLHKIEPDIAVKAEQALHGIEAALDRPIAEHHELVTGLGREAVDEFEVQRAVQRGQPADVDAVVEGTTAGVCHGGRRGATEFDDSARGVCQRQAALVGDQSGRVPGSERSLDQRGRVDDTAAGQRGPGSDDERAKVDVADLPGQASSVEKTFAQLQFAVKP